MRAHLRRRRADHRPRPAGRHLRPDFAHEDLLFVFGTNALLARAVKDTAPDAWRRSVAFTLDGLRTEAARPLPAPPLSLEQAYRLVENLTGTP
ncbi:hypothetical protein ACGFZQ_38725 [Streptomyces sp. NPDC048254]|uniref:hypothetical protein n=1 Tax=Streptomyces sp. NPDC048254 TaxID=3365525 RepID=UPI00371DF524